jgi:hypothetical protein
VDLGMATVTVCGWLARPMEIFFWKGRLSRSEGFEACVCLYGWVAVLLLPAWGA